MNKIAYICLGTKFVSILDSIGGRNLFDFDLALLLLD